MLGAGATGGAFGTLLLEAGRDVTFLVRGRRAESLRREGLHVVTTEGEHRHDVNVLEAGEQAEAFDLIIVTVKAAALPAALESVRPYVTPSTKIMPILNGMAHMDVLENAFPGQVLGGLAKIFATLDGNTVRQFAPMTTLTVGKLDGSAVPAEIVEALKAPGIDLTVSDHVVDDMWDKWTFIATAGVITCLFRGSVGDIIAAGGREYILQAIDELESVSVAAGHPVSDASHAQSLQILDAEGSPFTSSLYRDVIAGGPTEAEHILGDFQRRARQLSVETPLLNLALVQLRANALLS